MSSHFMHDAKTLARCMDRPVLKNVGSKTLNPASTDVLGYLMDSTLLQNARGAVKLENAQRSGWPRWQL